MKTEQANKIKDERRMLKEMKNKLEFEKKHSRNKKIMELEKLEQDYLEELNRRSQRKNKISESFSKHSMGSTPRVKRQPKLQSSISNDIQISLFSPKAGQNPDQSDESTNYYDFPLSYKKKLDLDSSDDNKSENLVTTPATFQENLCDDSPRNPSKMRLKKRSRVLPLILTPMKSDLFMVHILGENSKLPTNKIKSSNNTPSRPNKTDNDSFNYNLYHVIREFEIPAEHQNSIDNSKYKLMKDYANHTVKRNFTPKPSINKKLQVESIKLKAEMKQILSKMQRFQLFKQEKTDN